MAQPGRGQQGAPKLRLLEDRGKAWGGGGGGEQKPRKWTLACQPTDAQEDRTFLHQPSQQPRPLLIRTGEREGARGRRLRWGNRGRGQAGAPRVAGPAGTRALPVAQRATKVCACLRMICLFSSATGILERKCSMKSCGVMAARFHLSLFTSSSSICWGKGGEQA